MYVVLKIVVKVSFISIIVWLVEENRKKKKKAKPADVWALKLNIPFCLTGNTQVSSRLKIRFTE